MVMVETLLILTLQYTDYFQKMDDIERLLIFFRAQFAVRHILINYI
jgi:hypothetical protein